MKAKIKMMPMYSIEIGNKMFYDFKKESEWEGMVKFINNKNEAIIVDSNKISFQVFFDNLLGSKKDSDQALEMNIVKITSGLMGDVKDKENEID